MNPRVKQLWIEALTSGDYEQSAGYLKRDDKFCALGVLVDLYRDQTHDGEWVFSHVDPDGRVVSVFETQHGRVISQLPIHVKQWAGLYQYQNQMRKLTFLNDMQLRSFEEIADWIGKNL